MGKRFGKLAILELRGSDGWSLEKKGYKFNSGHGTFGWLRENGSGNIKDRGRRIAGGK